MIRPSFVQFNKTVLDKGVTVLSEYHPGAHAVHAGVFFDRGSRDEPSRWAGFAHFLEHLVWKRTTKRTAYELVKSIEELGGEANAYTGREQTCHHAVTLGEHWRTNLDVIMDVVWNAAFDSDDFEKERSVVFSEIQMNDDDLPELIFDRFFEKAYKGNPLGVRILGTKSSLGFLKHKKTLEYHREFYRPQGAVISLAGQVNHVEVLDFVQSRIPNVAAPKVEKPRKIPQFQRFVDVFSRESEQVHLLLGAPSVSFKDPLRFEAYLVNSFLGGGMTSRLYQVVREERGWAYSIFSMLQPFSDCGVMNVYVGCARKYVYDLLALLLEELLKLGEKGLTEEDLALFKRQVEGEILLNSDDLESRMNSLAVNEFLFGEYRSTEQIMAEIEKVSLDSVQSYLKKFIKGAAFSVALAGDLDRSRARGRVLKLMKEAGTWKS